MINKTERFFKKALATLPKLQKNILIDLSKELIYERSLLVNILDNISIAVIAYQNQQIVFSNQQYDLLKKEIPNLYLDQTGTIAIKDIYKKNRMLNIVSVSKESYKFIYIVDIIQQNQQDLDNIIRKSFESLENLAAGISHEIKNPLSAIDIHTQIIQKNIKEGQLEVSDEITNYLSIVQKESSRLLEVLNTFLSITRQNQLTLLFTEIATIIENINDIFNEELKQKNIQLIIQNNNIPKVFTSPTILQQIVIDLIRNAIEAMENIVEKIIKISLQESNTKSNIIIVIEDSGIGIPKNLQNKVFEPYFSTKQNGTGLGLTLVKKMVKELGGEIILNDSELGGAKFEIYFPISLEQKKLLSN